MKIAGNVKRGLCPNARKKQLPAGWASSLRQRLFPHSFTHCKLLLHGHGEEDDKVEHKDGPEDRDVKNPEQGRAEGHQDTLLCGQPWKGGVEKWCGKVVSRTLLHQKPSSTKIG